MCLGIPMKIKKVTGDTAVVESGGLSRTANVSFIKRPRPGQYVLIHAGFAIERLSGVEARRTLRALSAVRAA